MYNIEILLSYYEAENIIDDIRDVISKNGKITGKELKRICNKKLNSTIININDNLYWDSMDYFGVSVSNAITLNETQLFLPSKAVFILTIQIDSSKIINERSKINEQLSRKITSIFIPAIEAKRLMDKIYCHFNNKKCINCDELKSMSKYLYYINIDKDAVWHTITSFHIYDTESVFFDPKKQTSFVEFIIIY